jgi:hypothetical protein
MVALVLVVGLGSPGMAQTTAFWLDPVSGNWTDAPRWSTNPLYPGQGGVGEAVIDATGSPYTVTSATPITIESLTIGAADATWRHAAGTFTSPVINVAAGTALLDGGTLQYPASGTDPVISSGTNMQPGGTFRVDAGQLLAPDRLLVKDVTVVQTGGLVSATWFQLFRAEYHMAGGTFELGGATFDSGQVLVAPNATGAVIQTGGTILQTADVATFGAPNSGGTSGNGTLIVDGPASVYRTHLDGRDDTAVGLGTAAIGHAIFRDGARGDLVNVDVGSNAGHGTMLVQSGARVTASNLLIGTGRYIVGGGTFHGHGTVILDGLGSSLSLKAAPLGAVAVGGNSSTLSSARLVINNGTFEADVTQVTRAGTVQFNGGHFDSGIIIFGGRMDVAPGRDKVVYADGLTFMPGPGRLDLSDNAMAIDLQGTNTIETIRGYIATGHAGGAWTGNALTSSAAAANPGYALGYAEAGELPAVPPLRRRGGGRRARALHALRRRGPQPGRQPR